MIIGGLQKLSLSDYPGHSACVVFTLGCNFRCGYCHDAEMVMPELHPSPSENQHIFDFLRDRIGKLDAVVVCGGEPTIHHDLPDFIVKIKAMGYLVKLDSNGTNPKVIKQLIDDKLIDFVAMDIKGPYEKYSDITNRPVDLDAIKESIDVIMNSGIGYEFRTTVVQELLDYDDFHKMGKMIKGAQRYALQKFNPVKTLHPEFSSKKPYEDIDMNKIKDIMSDYVQECVVH